MDTNDPLGVETQPEGQSAVQPEPQLDQPLVEPKAKSPATTLTILIIVALLLVGGGWWWFAKGKGNPVATPSPSPTAETRVLRVGTIIDENGLEADKQEFTPFLNYLVAQLGDQGITKAEFVPETSVSEMAELMREGKVDLYIDSIFPVFVTDRLAGAQLMADRWKEGVEKYHGAIFVKKDSPIASASDLKGRMIAIDSVTSTVSYFLPKAELIKQGYTLTEKQKSADSVSPNEIGYQFVHGSVFDDVANGILPAGAESEQEIRDHFGATFDQNYRIIMTTPDVLRFAVTSRKDLNTTLRSAIKTILLGMDQSAAGKEVLKSFAGTTKFTDVGTDTDASYGEIQKLTDTVEQEIIQGGLGATH